MEYVVRFGHICYFKKTFSVDSHKLIDVESKVKEWEANMDNDDKVNHSDFCGQIVETITAIDGKFNPEYRINSINDYE